MKTPNGPDLARMQSAVIEMLSAIGDDPAREGLQDTPRRISEMYAEIFEGLWNDPRDSPTCSRRRARRCAMSGPTRAKPPLR